MEELSIEEKAKRYDKAIVKARNIVNSINVGLIGKDSFEAVFPELKEPEDKRIRNFISNELVCLRATEGKDSDRYKELTNAIAWFEKQGEHINFLSKIQIGDKVTCNENGILVNLSQLNRIAKKRGEQNTNLPSFDEAQGTPIVKQGEQSKKHDVCNTCDEKDSCISPCCVKLVEEQGEQKFRIGDTITNGDLVGIIDEINEYGYHACFGDHYADVPYKGIENWKLVEQKPAEYEKPLLEKFKQAVYDCAWGKVTCKVEGESKQEYANRWAESLLLMVRDWADDYIDSREDVIRRRAYDEGKNCHKPAEWSEEDENRFKNLIFLVECSNENEPTKKGFINFINRLKVLRSQNSWKPTSDQLAALFCAIPYIHCSSTRACACSLYRDLKKLIKI